MPETPDQTPDLSALAAELDGFAFQRCDRPLSAELDENGVVILSDAVTGAVVMMTEADWHALRAYPTKTGPKPYAVPTKARLQAREDDQVYAALDALGRDE